MVTQEIPVPTAPETDRREFSETKRSVTDVLFYAQPKKIAVALSAERNPVIAFVLSFFPQVNVKETLLFMPDRKKDLEILFKSMKKNAMTDPVKDKILEILADRVERLSMS